MEDNHMLNIMKLEMKKYKMRGSVIGGFITTLIWMAFIILINYDEESVMKNYEDVIGFINITVSCTFIIFAATLIAKYIINEYKDKTITVLFMYPIPRKKFLISKLIIISAFTFIFGIISKLIIFSGVYFFNQYAHFFEQELTSNFLWKNGVELIINSFLMSCVSLIPLYFGMRKHSVSTTIVSSVIISLLLYSNVSVSGSNFTLSSIVIIPTIVSIVGLLIAYSVIHRIEQKDVV